MNAEEERRQLNQVLHRTPWTQTEEIRQLLVRGADINSRDEQGYTLLMKVVENFVYGEMPPSCYEPHAQIAYALLDLGADPNMRYPGGSTMLIQAARHGELPVVEVLLNYGADLHAEDLHNGPFLGGTALHAVLLPEVSQLLIDRGAEINHLSLRSETALQIAKNMHADDVVEVLKKAGAKG